MFVNIVATADRENLYLTLYAYLQHWLDYYNLKPAQCSVNFVTDVSQIGTSNCRLRPSSQKEDLSESCTISVIFLPRVNLNFSIFFSGGITFDL